MSQFNIDKFISNFFQGFKGTFLETGSSHPTDQNNTFALERMGWSGMLIEPRKDHNNEYKTLRPNSIIENYALVGKNFEDKTIKAFKHEYGHMFNVTAIHEHDQEVTEEWEVCTLDKLLRKHNLNTIDFFSLDVEGYEHEVLDGIDFSYVRFGVIVIETHSYEWNGRSDDFTYLNQYGYSRVYDLSPNHQVWVNDILPLKPRKIYSTNL